MFFFSNWWYALTKDRFLIPGLAKQSVFRIAAALILTITVVLCYPVMLPLLVIKKVVTFLYDLYCFRIIPATGKYSGFHYLDEEATRRLAAIHAASMARKKEREKEPNKPE